jgi:hypothetical protein
MAIIKKQLKKIMIATAILAVAILGALTIHQLNQVKSAFADSIKTRASQSPTDVAKSDKTTTTIVVGSNVSSGDISDLKKDIGDLKVTPDPRGNGAFIGSGTFSKTYEDGTVEDFDSETGKYHITHKGPHWKEEIEADKEGK